MTVLTMPARPGHDTAPPPVPWRRMVWVTWRQHRATMISVPAVLGALALFLLFAGLKVHHDYAVLTPATRRARPPARRSTAPSTAPTGPWEHP